MSEGYKMTELGEIPVEWDVKEFENIMLPKGEGIRRGPFGGALKKEIFVESGYAVYEQQHVIHNLKDSFRYFITEEKFTELKGFEVLPGDILISCSGTVGKVLVVPKESPKGVINQALLRLRAQLDEIDINFLYYLLTSEFVQKRMLDMTHGSALKNMVSIAELKSILLAIPNTIEEQQKIASILSTVDEQIDETEQLIAKTKELKKGLMQQLLTKGIGHTEFKRTEFGEIPVGWGIRSFEDIMQPKGDGIRRGPFGGALKKEIFVKSGYAVYEQQHVIHNLKNSFRYYITEEKFAELKSFEVLPGDVLISCSGTVGKVLIVPKESPFGVINQALLRLRAKLKEIDIKFLYYLLTSDLVQKRMLDMTHGSALKNMVSIAELKSILLAIPNTLEEQQKIAEILSTVDDQIEVYEQEKSKYEELKKGLMQQLLTGQIRMKI